MGHGQVPNGGIGSVQPRPLAVVEGVVAVDDTETVLAVADPSRRGLVIQNNGGVNVRVGDNTLSSTKGILLSPTGSPMRNPSSPPR